LIQSTDHYPQSQSWMNLLFPKLIYGILLPIYIDMKKKSLIGSNDPETGGLQRGSETLGGDAAPPKVWIGKVYSDDMFANIQTHTRPFRKPPIISRLSCS
jgi:hypothetical protein